MGVEQVRWVIEYSPVDGAAYTVLLVLAVLADDDALISCSHSSLGRDCRLDRGTVARVIKQLVDVGAIEQLDAPAGRRPGCYLLHCAAVQGRSARTVQQLADRTAARSARTVQQLRAPARPDTSNTAMPTPPPDTLTRANTNEQAELFGNYEANASSALADARTARARKGKDASKSKVKSARATERVPREHELVARATDSAGGTQPEHVRDRWNPKGYMNDAWHRIRVTAG